MPAKAGIQTDYPRFRPCGARSARLAMISAHMAFFLAAENKRSRAMAAAARKLGRLDAATHGWVDAGRIAGVVTLVARRGKVVHLDAYGMADVEHREPMTKDTYFRLFSMTKPVTSVALLTLYEQGKFQLTDIPPALREAADGIGLTAWQKLRLVEMPLASRSILAGVKTAAVINVGTATLGALIDAGGLGVPIQQGLRTHDNGLILLGAIPAAGLALLAEGLFGLVGRVVVPRGLRQTLGR